MLKYGIFILILLVLTIICCGPHIPEQATLDGQIAIERWPEEGVPVIAWTGPASSMAVYSRPGDMDSADHLAVKKDQQLQWDTSLILVKKLGQMKILEDCVISALVYDALEDKKLVRGRPRQINFASGTILEVVCYAAEGCYIFHYQGKYVEMSGSNAHQQMLVLPQTEWWVRVEKDDKPIGWVRVDEENVSVVDRRF